MAGVGVVVRLLRQQLAIEQALVAIEIGLRQLQVRLALTDRRLGHLIGGLGLPDLLLNLAVLDFGDHLAAPHRIAQVHVDACQAAVDLRHGLHGGGADETADDQHALGERRALRGRELDRHGRPGAAAARLASAAGSRAARVAARRLGGAPAVDHEARDGHRRHDDEDDDHFAHDALCIPPCPITGG